jgi:hypothetical protein
MRKDVRAKVFVEAGLFSEIGKQILGNNYVYLSGSGMPVFLSLTLATYNWWCHLLHRERGSRRSVIVAYVIHVA